MLVGTGLGLLSYSCKLYSFETGECLPAPGKCYVVTNLIASPGYHSGVTCTVCTFLQILTYLIAQILTPLQILTQLIAQILTPLQILT